MMAGTVSQLSGVTQTNFICMDAFAGPFCAEILAVMEACARKQFRELFAKKKTQ
jgi:hypothetical protein